MSRRARRAAPMADLIVAGAGMAGLCAAAEARARGADVLLLEKAAQPGGSMLLSSGVVWRHTEWRDFRAECPGGDEALQRLVWERLDEGLAWLESLGAPVVERDTGNPRTTGVRFATAELTRVLDRAAGGARCGAALESLPEDGTPVVLATGGFAANQELVRRWITPQADELLLRAAPGCTGDGLRMGLGAGGVASDGLDEFYGRNMPAPPARVSPADFVRLAQLYARHATVTDLDGVAYTARTWSEIDVVQWTARRPAARALYRVEPGELGAAVRERTVADMVAAAEAAGADVRHERDGAVVVPVRAAITTTLGGLRVTPEGQAAPGVWAAGADAGGIATGGYASGLAAALVLGRIAAAAALGERPPQATRAPASTRPAASMDSPVSTGPATSADSPVSTRAAPTHPAPTTRPASTQRPAAILPDGHTVTSGQDGGTMERSRPDAGARLLQRRRLPNPASG